MRKKHTLLGVAGVITGTIAGGCGRDVDQILSPELTLAQVMSAVSPAVTGSGQYVTTGGLRTFAFTVRTMPDGSVRGQFSGVNHQTRVHWSGSLDCLVVDGNTAWIGGAYERSSNPSLIGLGFAFKAVDHGEGSGALPDSMSRAMRGGTDCSTRPEPSPDYFYEIFGNIQIHR